MSCLLAAIALFFPRIIILIVWLASDFLEDAYVTTIWPVLGFFFLPLTTLAYAWAWHSGEQGSVSGFGIVVIVIAVLIDLGLIGGGASSRSRTKA